MEKYVPFASQCNFSADEDWVSGDRLATNTAEQAFFSLFCQLPEPTSTNYLPNWELLSTAVHS